MKNKLLVFSSIYLALLMSFAVYLFIKGDSNYLGYRKQLKIAQEKESGKGRQFPELEAQQSAKNEAKNTASSGGTSLSNSTSTGNTDANTQGASIQTGTAVSNPVKAVPAVVDYSDVKFSTNVLLKGATGDEVKKIQYLLKKGNYYTGTINGNFDEPTVEAVKKFQQSVGLGIDGQVGQGTKNKLLEIK